MLVATAALFRVVPGSLAPNEDQGYILAIPLLQDAASLERTEAATEQLTRCCSKHPAVDGGHRVRGHRRPHVRARAPTPAFWVSAQGLERPPRQGPEPRSAVAAYVFAARRRRSAMRCRSRSSRRRSRGSARPAGSRPTSSRAAAATTRRSRPPRSSSPPRRPSARSSSASRRPSRRACRRSASISTASRPSCSAST